MMAARRMSRGARLACECALATTGGKAPGALVFTSRHGELPRGEKLLTALAAQTPLSPTDFMMSVHNAAVGMLSISQKWPVPSSSVASGTESFHAGLIEAAGMLADSIESVLVVDFENALPPLLQSAYPAGTPSFDYATAFLLTRGPEFSLSMKTQTSEAVGLPASLQLWAALKSGQTQFVTQSAGHRIAWCRQQS